VTGAKIAALGLDQNRILSALAEYRGRSLTPAAIGRQAFPLPD
jgi:hypothetical protein